MNVHGSPKICHYACVSDCVKMCKCHKAAGHSLSLVYFDKTLLTQTQSVREDLPHLPASPQALV